MTPTGSSALVLNCSARQQLSSEIASLRRDMLEMKTQMADVRALLQEMIVVQKDLVTQLHRQQTQTDTANGVGSTRPAPFASSPLSAVQTLFANSAGVSAGGAGGHSSSILQQPPQQRPLSMTNATPDSSPLAPVVTRSPTPSLSQQELCTWGVVTWSSQDPDYQFPK